MSDNAILVQVYHAGLYFDAMVEITDYDEIVELFYNDADVTELLRLFDSRSRNNIERMAIKAAMKKLEEQGKDNKHEASLYG